MFTSSLFATLLLATRQKGFRIFLVLYYLLQQFYARFRGDDLQT